MAEDEPSQPRPVSWRKRLGLVALVAVLVVIAFQLGWFDFYVGWRSQHYYQHTKPEWRNEIYGVELLQFPQDLVVYHDILLQTKPDVIVETGTYRGGSTLYFSTLLEFINPKARIITVDIDGQYWRGTLKKLDVANKDKLLERITFVEGSSIKPETVAEVQKLIPKDAKVMVVLDSSHTYPHVREELKRYAPLVTVGQYLIVNDTQWVAPLDAIKEFIRDNPDFVIDDSVDRFTVSCAHSGFLKRVK